MKRLLMATSFLMISAFAAPANAQLAVYDAPNSIQQIQQIIHMVEQIESMAKDFENQVDQLRNLEDQLSAMTGSREMGSLLNGIIEEELRRYLPQEMDDFLIIDEAGAYGTVSETQAASSEIREIYDIDPGEEIYPDDPILAKAHDRVASGTTSSMGTATVVYNNYGPRLRQLEGMMAAIDTTTDIKASTDLNSRISVEIALLQMELLRLQAIQIETDGAQAMRDLADEEELRVALEYDPEIARDVIK